MNIPTILIVDDDADARRSLRALLEAAGYGVKDFASGETLLQSGVLVGECVILDVRMGAMDSLDELDEMLRRAGGVPVVVITSHADVSIAVRAMKAGAMDFLQKPFPCDRLLEGVRRALLIGAQNRCISDDVKAAQGLVSRLTPRERDVMDLIVGGLSSKIAAHELGISPRTVEVHRAKIATKLRVHGLSKIVGIALMARRPESAAGNLSVGGPLQDAPAH